MAKRLYLYPVWIRLWHILNALLFLALIATGLALQFAGKGSDNPIIPFDKAVAIHNTAAVVLMAGYLYFLIGNFISSNKKHYRIPKENFWKDLIIQARFYAFGMFKKEKHPFPVTEDSKFNPLQRLFYALVMYIAMPVLILSGIGLLFPELLLRQFFGLSGLLIADILHVATGFFLTVFLIIHIYTCTLGDKPGTLFKSMINGYHDEHD
ncbi:MAG: cytochrome b/b6 domain-containing protein [Marinilabiliaceae bacterium]|jgi:thiosulfate reductase cytochrome b subunit|nr:cytochrome b/b6 domain-containing protein [Marinilabiliaceae bacterium]